MDCSKRPRRFLHLVALASGLLLQAGACTFDTQDFINTSASSWLSSVGNSIINTILMNSLSGSF